MIKGNESDVRNVDFELQTERDDKMLCFITVFEHQINVLQLVSLR